VDPTPQAAAFALQCDAHGRLVLLLEQGRPPRRHVGVEPVRAFPLSSPRHGIALCDAGGRELLWIECLDDLPPGPRAALEEALAVREFVPILRRVVRINAPAEPCEWEVETDRGPTRFVLNSEEDVHPLDRHGALIRDAQGLRYRIPDLRQLDAVSRRLLERYL
jgi:hypothetical protein